MNNTRRNFLKSALGFLGLGLVGPFNLVQTPPEPDFLIKPVWGKMTDVHINEEAWEELKRLSINQIDDLTYREIYLNNHRDLPGLYGMKFNRE